jgi:REP element-mobilizing transposase RayT
VFNTREKDIHGKPVYLSDIMESVKKHTAKEINKAIGRQGHLWQKESFDTTIRDHKHLYHAIEYTLNNPVAAGYIQDRNDWPGTWGSGSL